MSEGVLTLSPAKYYEQAKIMLEKKDILGFVSKLAVAIELAGADKDLLSKATYLQVEGLYKFKQYKKALDSIDLARTYNIGKNGVTLRFCEGMIYAHLGEFLKGVEIFEEVLTHSEDRLVTIDSYINLAWIYLMLAKKESPNHYDKAKEYLDISNVHFNELEDNRKWKILNNYSIYYFGMKNYDKAIECLEESIKYAVEKDLPHIYTNLTEIYLKIDNSHVPAKIDEYLDKAEVIATKYKCKLALGYVFSARAHVELQNEQFFKALDTLYLAFEHFKEAEAYNSAFECMVKINELMNDHKINGLKALKESFKEFEEITFFTKIK